MSVTLVLPQNLVEEIQDVTRIPEETAGVMLVGIAKAPGGDLRILGRAIRWVSEDAYIRREWNGLSIKSEGYVRALAEAEALGASCLWVHTHPGEHAWPGPSEHDRVVDEQIKELFRLRSGSAYYGAVIFSPQDTEFAFTGHIGHESGPQLKIDRLWEVGDRWRLTRAADIQQRQLSPIYDRNIRAFGEAIQQTLGDLTVGVVGCGGTGSATAEQLVRLGIRKLILIDPDHLSESNVTRVYGSSAASVGLPKVEVLARHLSAISPGLECETFQSMLTLEPIARRLVGCDLVFGCTDDNAGRLVLSRMSTYFLMPIIDCGVLLSSDGHDQLIGIDGRVTILSPGQACLICRGRVDLVRAGAELLTPDERRRREDEGYAPALARTEPAVVTFTTMVAAAAVSELLERLIGYGPDHRPSEILLRCHEREISTNTSLPRERHYCHPSSNKMGIGMTNPFLEQTWPD